MDRIHLLTEFDSHAGERVSECAGLRLLCVLVCAHIHAPACLCVCERACAYMSMSFYFLFYFRERRCVLTRARVCQTGISSLLPTSPILAHPPPTPLPPAHAPVTAPAAGARRRALAGSNPGPSACEADVVPLHHMPGHCFI